MWAILFCVKTRQVEIVLKNIASFISSSPTLFLLLNLFSPVAHADLQLAAYVTEDVIAPVNTSGPDKTPPIIAVESPYDYETTLQNIKKSIAGRNFRLIRVQEFTDGFSHVNNGERNTIVYFCNFDLVNQAIKIDSRIGQFLPCRITVHEKNGKVYLMALNPVPIGELLGHEKLKKICVEVTAMYRTLLEEATL